MGAWGYIGIPWGLATGEMSGSSSSVLIILLSYVPSVIHYQDEGAVPSEDVATKVYWLVVWSPLKNMSSSVGMMTFPNIWKVLESHNPFMFQTTEENIPWCDVFCAHSCWYRSTELMRVRAYGYDYVDKCRSPPQVGEKNGIHDITPRSLWFKFCFSTIHLFFWGGIIGISWGYIEWFIRWSSGPGLHMSPGSSSALWEVVTVDPNRWDHPADTPCLAPWRPRMAPALALRGISMACKCL